MTGGTSGIGFHIALGLARMGANVTLGARTDERGQAAIGRIRNAVPETQPDYLAADLSAMSQVRSFAERFLERQPVLHVLVNNVGGFFLRHRMTADGYEMTFALNHLSYFLLTNLLLERLIASAPARVVNVSSASHYQGKIHFEDFGLQRGYGFGNSAYAQSKLANVLFTYELARRLGTNGVTANAVHPGLVRTGLSTKNTPWPLRPWVALVVSVLGISQEAGASAPLMLATAPELEGVSGEYYDRSRAVHSSALSYDQATAQRLWEVSAQLTGVARTDHQGFAPATT